MIELACVPHPRSRLDVRWFPNSTQRCQAVLQLVTLRRRGNLAFILGHIWDAARTIGLRQLVALLVARLSGLRRVPAPIVRARLCSVRFLDVLQRALQKVQVGYWAPVAYRLCSGLKSTVRVSMSRNRR